MLYLYLKSLHIIFVVCWFAGLFYIVRLFVYYAETADMNKTEQTILRNQYTIMTNRLWNIITWPAAILTTIFGVWMLIETPMWLSQPWMHIKLLFVVLLFAYHMKCHQFVKQINNRTLTKTSSFFRIWNEGATLILFSVVFLVILKSTVTWVFGVVGLVGLSILLMLGIKLYKNIRERNKN
ncbi:CopD family protein [Myroides pelagicus]|uniref:Protoporphyrinogen IX oxidase n=1 Tax=Myroides pelagicus TaxID=270914 RepID=A0A7K1GPX6_9FLAO|nr:CopD family protein [Myroides pelagicus]MEC4112693.1 CopD family protein [Myroides pelagicus]MTH30906.1 protoporphyrinogen IX oxidase [Myroides pelagicus]